MESVLSLEDAIKSLVRSQVVLSDNAGSTKTGPFHDLSRYPAHEEGPQHYGAKAEIKRTALLQVG